MLGSQANSRLSQSPPGDGNSASVRREHQPRNGGFSPPPASVLAHLPSKFGSAIARSVYLMLPLTGLVPPAHAHNGPGSHRVVSNSRQTRLSLGPLALRRRERS